MNKQNRLRIENLGRSLWAAATGFDIRTGPTEKKI